MNTTLLRQHQRKLIVAAISMAIVLGIAITFSFSQAYAADFEKPAANEHIITLHDDGVEKGFITKKHTLREALADAKVRIDERDRTEPSLDEKLTANSYEVNVYRARPVLIRDTGNETKVITSYRTPKQIAKEAKLTLQDEDIVALSPSNDPIADGAAEVMTIDRAIAFSFDFYGKITQSYTQANTVKEMLKEKGITMQSVDGLAPGAGTAISAGMQIRLWRNGVQTVTVEEDIKFETKKIEDADQAVGYRKVETEGQDGKRTVTYEINMQNGVEIARKEINSVTTKQPTQQVETIGTKGNYSDSLQAWLLALRTCETGGNYTRNSGNGYYGAYQFLPSTWNNIALKSGRSDLVGILPSTASPADQDAMVIANTNMTAGLRTQHPGCYTKLGLANKPPAE